MNNLKRAAAEVLSLADIEIGGGRSWDIQVHNDAFYPRVIAEGSLGAGESYMDGWWDVERLDELVYRVLRARLHEKVNPLKLLLPVVQAKVQTLQARPRRADTVTAHYDLGNDFFRHMLDARMVYSCGYWRDATNLDDAQQAKLDLVCRKIGLQAGMRVLDIGCGWGSFAKFAAEEYGAHVVGITTSQPQAEHARQVCAGLPVEIRALGYREINEPFDRVISLGMFEHVGHRNHRRYMRVAQRCLRDDGLFLLHSIGDNVTTTRVEPWIARYIFPDGDLPSMAQITRAVEKLFIVEDVHNFGAYYDKTLMAWFENFDRAWDQFEARYGERFYRMWKFYLLSCAGAFRARYMQLWQTVLAPRGQVGGYTRMC
ncbi:MAG: cyclopropane fatty acyl phospholipid synthase [Gammaproteobacteria bacterium]